MKLKQRPDDFQVEELTEVTPGEQGPFALYRLEKRGWSTVDALAAVRRRWKLDHRRLSYGGLKDRHAATVQYFTVYRGPNRNLTHHQVHVTYLGQTPAPFRSPEIRANRFRITLRALPAAALERMQPALASLPVDGVPNYFDDQRFGSVGPDREFVGRLIVRGEFEKALKLALAGEYEHDRAEQKREKELLLSLWGNWEQAKAELPRGHARSLVDYLRQHPSDFRGAVTRLRPELRGLYLSAYQSYLWNRMLALEIQAHVPSDRLMQVRLRSGPVPLPLALDDPLRQGLHGLVLPLPSARLRLDADDSVRRLVDRVMKEEGFPLEELRVKGVRDLFFSRGDRPAFLVPAKFTSARGADDLNPGRQKLTLGFELPRGAYATMVVKRLALRPGESIEPPAEEDE